MEVVAIYLHLSGSKHDLAHATRYARTAFDETAFMLPNEDMTSVQRKTCCVPTLFVAQECEPVVDLGLPGGGSLFLELERKYFTTICSSNLLDGKPLAQIPQWVKSQCIISLGWNRIFILTRTCTISFLTLFEDQKLELRLELLV